MTSTTYTWTAQGQTANWNDPGNWSVGGPPGTADIAAFTGVDSTIAGNAMVGAILAEGAQSDLFTGSITVLGLAAETYAVTIGANAQVGFAAGAALATPTLAVGTVPGSGALSLDGALLSTTAATIGAGGGQGTLSLTGGSVWTNAGRILVGAANGSIGDLSVTASAELFLGTTGHHAHAGDLVLGAAAGSEGALGVSGGGVIEALNANIALGGAIGSAHHGTGQMAVGAAGYVDVGGTLSINAGSALSLADGSVAAGTLMNAAGGLIAGSGSLGGTSLVNNGEILAQGSLILDPETISGSGTVALSSFATVTLGAALSGNGIAFLGADAALSLLQFASIGGTISGFAAGDTLLVEYADHVSFDHATDQLTLSGGSGAVTLTLSGDYAGDRFHIHTNGDFGAVTLSHA